MNSVNVIGKLATDPDLHHNGQGRPTAVFNLAIDDRRNGDTCPVLITVVTHDASATTVARYLRRDRLVSVEGRLQQVSGANQHRQWSRVQIAASWVGFLDTPHPPAADRGPLANSRTDPSPDLMTQSVTGSTDLDRPTDQHRARTAAMHPDQVRRVEEAAAPERGR